MGFQIFSSIIEVILIFELLLLVSHILQQHQFITQLLMHVLQRLNELSFKMQNICKGVLDSCTSMQMSDQPSPIILLFCPVRTTGI